ncbi:MAG: ATP-binding cassette domain-containing protein [Desulfovibrionaceae bacterium]
MPPVIIAKDLYKCYPGSPPVLRGVNISVEEGEIVAIMGPSGCGKSTMLHVLGMLHTPDSGTLEVLNTNVLTLNREETAAFRRSNLGFVMQSCNLFDHSTVFENVEFPLIYEGVPPEERWERVIRALDLVRLSTRVHYRSNRLSGGEQQRVAIARAMVNNPRILLADEPTGALDFRTSRAVMDNFRTLAHEGGVAMVVVTHDQTVAQFCDTVYTLEDGILVCQKKDPLPELPPSAKGTSLLCGPKRLMNAACITARFPQPTGVASVQDMLKLYSAGVLARIYSTRGTEFLSFEADPFGLPLAVRRMGVGLAPTVLASFLSHAHKNSGKVWSLWCKLPFQRWYSIRDVLAQIWNFSCGTLLTRWMQNDNIEHIYADGAHGPATAAWVASHLTGTPFSFQVRTADLQTVHSSLSSKAADAAFIRCDTADTLTKARAACPGVPADKFVLLPPVLPFPLSDETAYSGEEDTVDPTNPQKKMMPMNVENSVKHTQEPSTAIPPDSLRLLAAGHICARKGYKTLLHACALLHAAGTPVHLTIAGKGPSLWCLRLLRLRLGLRKVVTFSGHVPHDRMERLFQEANVFVASGLNTPTNHDGLPTAVIEAMEYGLAIVATTLDAQQEVLTHRKNALLVEPGNAQALADTLKELEANPTLVKILGSTAQKDALRHCEHEDAPSALAQLILKYNKNNII